MDCPNLEHLQHCETYRCPHMFKCILNYCIAAHMICDHIADCPDGEDEESCDNFVCVGLLKCRGDDICVHPVNICDGVAHCISSGDDETLCDVPPCPSQCQCRGKAVQCQGPTNLIVLSEQTTAAILKSIEIDSSYAFQYFKRMTYLEINGCTFIDNALYGNTLFGLKYMMQLKLAGNNIEYIFPNAFQSMVKLVYIDLQSNVIKTICPLTFNNLQLLPDLDLSQLLLTNLQEFSFGGLVRLKNLNLSFNYLQTLKQSNFIDLENIHSIDLRFNSIKSIEHDTFFSLKSNVIIYFQTLTYCCYLIHNHECSVENNSYRNAQCNKLFTNNLTASVNMALSVVAMAINIILQWQIRNMKKRSSSYILLLGHSAAINLLPHLYIIVLVVASLYRNNDYIYLNSIWMQSSLCFFLNVLVTVGLIMPKIALFFIALNQLIAVKLAFKFKSNSVYLLNGLLLSWICVILIAIVKQILFPVGNMFCFPYLVDSSFTLGGIIYNSVMFVGMMLLIIGITSMNVLMIQHVRKSNISARSSKTTNNERLLKRNFLSLITIELMTLSLLLVFLLYSYYVPLYNRNVILYISIVIHTYVSVYTMYISSKVFS